MTDFQMVGLVLICLMTMLSIFKYLDHLKATSSWTYLFSGFVKLGRGEHQLPMIGHTVLIIIRSEVDNRYRYRLAKMDGFGKWCKPFGSEERLELIREVIVAWAPLEEPFSGEYP